MVLRLARGRLSSTTSRVRTEPGPNVAPLAAMGGAVLREPHKSEEPFWHLWPNPWAGPGLGTLLCQSLASAPWGMVYIMLCYLLGFWIV